MQSIINIFTSWRVDADHIDSSQISSILKLLIRNNKTLASRRQASISSLTKFFDLNVVLKQNSVSFSFMVSHISYSFGVVNERI